MERDLIQAIETNNVGRINQLIRQDPAILNKALYLAAYTNNTDVGQILINYGADVNYVNSLDNTPLDASIEHLDFLQLLLAQPQLSIDTKTKALGTHVSFAEINVVKLLLDAGAEPPSLSADYSLDLTNLLLDYGADLNAVDGKGGTVLSDLIDEFYNKFLRSQRPNNKEMIARIISDPKFDPDIILHKNDEDDDEDIGIDDDIEDERTRDETYLMQVALKDPNDDDGLIQLLLDAGADPTIKVNGMDAYEYARDNPYRRSGGCRTIVGYCAEKLQRAIEVWPRKIDAAIRELDQKFLIGQRLKTTHTLPQKQLRDYVIRKAEYDNLCQGLTTKLNKPGLIVLARSLKIPTANQSKFQLCSEIAGRLTLNPK